MLSLSRVVGHARLTSLLAHAIARDTLPPTLLFTGPGGVGKFLVARAAAATLNCQSPVTPASGLAIDACGACRSCDRVTRGVHVDVVAVEPDERVSIKIDTVREVLSRTAFRPFEGRRRVVIIQDADTLEPQAQNALLKSLEEPPPTTIFVLTTAVPGILLPTVRSRCMRLRFGRLTEAEVALLLTRDYDVAEGDARSTAALAGGSIGRAVAMGSSDLGVLRALALALLQHAAGRGLGTRLQTATEIAVLAGRKDRPREDVGIILRLAASMLRDIQVLNAGGEETALSNPALGDQLKSMQRAYAGDRGRNAFADLTRAIAAVDRPVYAGTKVVADWIAVHI